MDRASPFRLLFLCDDLGGWVDGIEIVRRLHLYRLLDLLLFPEASHLWLRLFTRLALAL